MNKSDEYGYRVTHLKYAVHKKGRNAIHGDEVIHVSIDDEGAGPFIELESVNAGQDTTNTVGLEMEELKVVLIAAKQLVESYEE